MPQSSEPSKSNILSLSIQREDSSASQYDVPETCKNQKPTLSTVSGYMDFIRTVVRHRVQFFEPTSVPIKRLSILGEGGTYLAHCGELQTPILAPAGHRFLLQSGKHFEEMRTGRNSIAGIYPIACDVIMPGTRIVAKHINIAKVVKEEIPGSVFLEPLVKEALILSNTHIRGCVNIPELIGISSETYSPFS